MMERWTRIITWRGREVEVIFVRRPFREGVEAAASVDGKLFKIAELGLGEEALIARLVAELEIAF